MKEPLSLAEALHPTMDGRLVTSIEHPHTIIHTNAAWAAMTGWKFTEVVGKTLAFLQGPATAGTALDALHAAIGERRYSQARIVNYRKDGTPFYCLLECSPVAGGTHFYATVRDEPIVDGSVAPISRPAPAYEQKPPVNYCAHARESSHHARRTTTKVRLADALKNELDPIILCSKEPPHVIIHPNQPWLEMCGYGLEEVEGLTNAILQGPETDREAVNEMMTCVRRGESSVQTLVNYKKGGVRFVNQVKTLPVYDENDDLAAFMAMLREIDEPVLQ
uniref:PAS domain-containing protein n=1 Tax=Prymnesium polylepis TaxID=72548 RepID=A0A6V4M3S7_9EUKA